MDIKEVKKLIEMVEQSDVDEFMLEKDGLRIEVKQNLPQGIAVPMTRQAMYTADLSVEEPAKLIEPKISVRSIKSPLGGTFYSASSPESPDFIKVGDKVTKGQVVCIIEAMKTFNEIEADQDGIVEQILLKNEDSLEQGQPLIILK